ncbi:Hypothetical protein A7982_09568 [Minicystis rosea]|nr:Hypothetical protein A7982_09568 [Minicystis rosea]
MDKLIFLDIDGVLNSVQYLAEHTGGEGVVIVDGEFDATAHIDPARVTRLNTLVERSGARVILSSSWRRSFGLEKTQRSLRAKGFAHELEGETVRLVGHPRHMEIRHYLAMFAAMPSFVVLDDAPEAGVGLGDHFILVSDGLEDAHVETAVAILDRGAPTISLALPSAED